MYHPAALDLTAPRRRQTGSTRPWRRAWLAGALVIATASGAARAADFPREDRGACPFECCRYGRWTARTPTAARARPDRRSTEVFRVARGEPVDALTGMVVTLRPGHARALTALQLEGVTIAAGQEVIVLRPVGEGMFKIWVADRVLEAVLRPARDSVFRLLSEPRIVWWVHVRDRQGRLGWTDQAERFDGSDGCG